MHKVRQFSFPEGIVILWAQLSVHQRTLGLRDRDLSDFVSVSSVFAMGVPFLSGIIADKIGEFKVGALSLFLNYLFNSFDFNL